MKPKTNIHKLIEEMIIEEMNILNNDEKKKQKSLHGHKVMVGAAIPRKLKLKGLLL